MSNKVFYLITKRNTSKKLALYDPLYHLRNKIYYVLHKMYNIKFKLNLFI